MRAIRDVAVRPLSVPLIDPFVRATARMDGTRAALVAVTLDDGSIGLGESAALPPVTREDQPDLLRSIEAAAASLVGAGLTPGGDVTEELRSHLDPLFPDAPVARAGVETAILDALSRARGTSLRALIGGEIGASTRTLLTDVTIPIHAPETMARLARAWRARGFDVFKI